MWVLLVDWPFVSWIESPSTESYRNRDTGNWRVYRCQASSQGQVCHEWQLTQHPWVFAIWPYVQNDLASKVVSRLHTFFQNLSVPFFHHASCPSWGPLHSCQLYVHCFVWSWQVLISSFMVLCVQLVAILLHCILCFKMDMGKTSLSFFWINNVSQAWTILSGAWPCVVHLSMVTSSRSGDQWEKSCGIGSPIQRLVGCWCFYVTMEKSGDSMFQDICKLQLLFNGNTVEIT